jgi:DNA-binding transcriptional ArsR family regulator
VTTYLTLAQPTLLDKYNYITNYIVMNKNYMRAIPREWRNLSKVFTALGDEHRQRILLTFSPGERLNVGQIVDVATLSRSAVSHHLRLLKEAGILQSRKEGKEVYFWIDKNFLLDAFETVSTFVRDNA